MENEQLYKSLKRRQRLSFFSVLVFIIGFASIVFFYFQSMKFKKDLKEKNELLEIQRNTISEMKNNLAFQSDSLLTQIAERDSLIHYLKKQNPVNHSDIRDQKIRFQIPDKEVFYQLNTEPRIQKYDNSKYVIGIQTYKTDKESLEKIKSHFTDKGYTVENNYNYDMLKPDWMADAPTVFYYSDKSAAKAKGIASELTNLLKKRFVVKKGSGLGVIPGQEMYTFYIHLIGK